MGKKIRIVTLISNFIFVCALVSASPVDRNTAKRKAAKYMPANTGMVFATDAGGEQPSYYVFNNVRKGKGFIIISGDDSTDEILGYSDSGSFNPDSIPENMKWWLDCIDCQVKTIRQFHPQRKRILATNTKKTAIAPLLTTNWGQEEPYNNLLPPSESNEKYPTGCVATALAQIVRYWHYDKPVKEIPAYTTSTLNIDVEELPEYRFQYNIMEDIYRATDTNTGVEETARLMRYCAQAVKMDFDPTGSGASVNRQLITNWAKYFSYNQDMGFYNRQWFSKYEWENIIYQELSHERPVFYAGANDYGRHAFVCDGYDGEQLFHINWGWNGRYNGYYKLSILDYNSQNNNSIQTGYGYIFNQTIITGIQPDNKNFDSEKSFVSVYNIKCKNNTYTRNSTNEDFTISFKYEYGATYETGNYDLGFTIEKDGEIIEYISWLQNTLVDDEENTVVLNFGHELSDGIYIIKPISKLPDTDNWNYNLYSETNYCVAVINDNDLTLFDFNDGGNYSINSITAQGSLRLNSAVDFKINVTNNSHLTNKNSYLKTLFLFVNNIYLGSYFIDLSPGETGDFIFRSWIRSTGTKKIVIAEDYRGNNILATTSFTVGGTASIEKNTDDDKNEEKNSVYNIAGQKIPTQQFQQTLPKGIYVVGRKKIVVK